MSKRTGKITSITKAEIPSAVYNSASSELCALQPYLPSPGSEVNALGWIRNVIARGNAVAAGLRSLYSIARQFPGTSILRGRDGMVYIKADFRKSADEIA